MRARVASLLVLLALAGRAPGDESSPHTMVGADGKLDPSACGVCHEDDLTLSRSELETCTLCHSVDTHAGSGRHTSASTEAVARVVPTPAEGSRVLPLTSEGKIYCGTCHLFHDPAVGGEKLLPERWVPPKRGLPGVVAEALRARWETMQATAGATEPVARFSGKGTSALRLPVSDGGLCLHCHRSTVK